MSEYNLGLNPVVKNFIATATILGPLAILGLILRLKKIEKDEPKKIRWK